MNAKRYAKKWSIIFVAWGLLNVAYGVWHTVEYGYKYHIMTSVTCAVVSFVFAYLIIKSVERKDGWGSNDKND